MMLTVYDKLRVLKDSVSHELKIRDARELFAIMARLSTWHYPKKRTKNMMLSKNELLVYEFLLKNKHNPSTCYKWMLATNTNEELQRKLKNGEISLKAALRKQPFKSLSQTEAEFLYQVKLCIQKYVIR